MSNPTDQARELTIALLATRASSASVCPSEVARALAASAGGDWRGAMPVVHAAVDQLVREGVIRLSWKAIPLSQRVEPYRIMRGE
ncbi:DUF3253 domain-containing protein [Sphingomonas sp. GB1N7]|uniref:DUF3253 domain-containing protein n=1 Tax=Parasphingomonas caseinilytica TaxID=3096158 RepID=UPI002FCA4DB9